MIHHDESGKPSSSRILLFSFGATVIVLALLEAIFDMTAGTEVWLTVRTVLYTLVAAITARAGAKMYVAPDEVEEYEELVADGMGIGYRYDTGMEDEEFPEEM